MESHTEYEPLTKYVNTHGRKCELCDKPDAWPEGHSGYEDHGLRVCEECYYRPNNLPPTKAMVKHLDRLRRELQFALAGHGPPVCEKQTTPVFYGNPRAGND